MVIKDSEAGPALTLNGSNVLSILEAMALEDILLELEVRHQISGQARRALLPVAYADVEFAFSRHCSSGPLVPILVPTN